MTPDMRDAMRRQVAVLHRTADVNDPVRQVEEDHRFHRLICEFSGNARLLRLFDDLASGLRLIIGLSGRLYDDPHGMARTDDPVLAALGAGHPERIVAHLEHHLRDGRRRIGELARAVPAARAGAPT